MKKNCLLIGINAKYIHTNLAVRYLKAYCEKQHCGITLKEFSINDSFDNILKEIYSINTQIYAFSCYIWNIELVLKLCSSLKKLSPHSIIILGGPEVSYDVEELMHQNCFIDYIIRGEGEATLSELLQLLNGEEKPAAVQGLTYRTECSIISSPERTLIQRLDDIPFPYEDLEHLNSKIIYYETSRGCPFNCQYCLSSTLHGVRYFSMERIKKDIKFFVDKGVKQVKLVDRTFNCNKRHSLEIIKYIIGLNSKTNFHFEIGADLLDDEMLEVLSKAPKDMFQLEIGVQSTNQNTLQEVSRTMNLDKVKQNVASLQLSRNIHLHLDLIAGLPYEDFISFGGSFDEVHQLLPDMLQLGFLKLLKGSGIRSRAKEYGIEFNSFNPYEVLKTKWLSYEELIILKEIEHILELYYNSGRFRNSLSYIFKNHCSSFFQFYRDFADYWRSSSLFAASQSTRELYNILRGFAESKKLMSLPLNELIKLDWLLYYCNGNMPSSLKRYEHGTVKKAVNNFLRENNIVINALFPNHDKTDRSLLKYIAYEVFFTDVFDNPELEQEYVVFYIKAADSEIRTIDIKLSDII